MGRKGAGSHSKSILPFSCRASVGEDPGSCGTERKGLLKTPELNRVAHVTTAHPSSDNRIMRKECTSLAEAGLDVELIAVATVARARSYTGNGCGKPSLSSAQVQQAWSATIDRLRKLGIISVLLRHSPLVPQAPEVPALISIVRQHPTIVLEPVDSDSAWSGLAGTCRTRIRKALKNGYTADVRQAASQDLAPFGDFRRLYEGTMERLDAAPLYFFSDQYYKGLLECLGPNLLIAEVRDAEGTPVSSALLMRHEHLLHYHLSGSNPDDASMGSNNLMLWTATQLAAEQGLRQFHLGGGLDRRDGLFHFKHTFGGRELGYDVSGLITDHEIYQTHTEDRARECEISADALLGSHYFPAYRGGAIEPCD